MQSKQWQDFAGSTIWGLLLIGVGVVFLLNTTGFVSWDVWGAMWKFWPIILIIWGMNSILGHKPWGAALVILVAVGLLVGSFVYVYLEVTPEGQNRQGVVISPSSFRVDLPDTPPDKVVLNLDVSATRLNMARAKNPETSVLAVVSGEAVDPLTKWIKTDYSGAGDFYLTVATPSVAMPGLGRNQLDVSFHQAETPLQLDVTANAADLDLDLDRLSIAGLDLDVNAGSAKVDLTNVAGFTASSSRIVVNAGNLTLKIKEDVGIRVRYDVNLGELTVGGESLQGKGQYTYSLPGMTASAWQLDIEVNAGKVEVEW